MLVKLTILSYFFSLFFIIFLYLKGTLTIVRIKVLLFSWLLSLISVFYLTDYMFWFFRAHISFVFLNVLILLKTFLYVKSPFFREVLQEVEDLNLPSDNDWMNFLRKFNTVLIFLSVSFLSISMYFYDNDLISFGSLLFSLLFFCLYILQSIFFIKKFYNRSKHENKRFFSVKTGAVLCSECLRLGLTIALTGEVGWKLYAGSLNSVPPWRSYRLNHVFPEDETKIWTESKAAIAYHNRSMGLKHTGQSSFRQFVQEVTSDKNN